ncbi:flagellar hook-associated protein FlgK [[Clostridium] polysaccharolyticum]|uniref:Flagellar hook-associated protein 1 n=1 Tax=[Clostridium] polysaccharolyticum TaxID=29364 RepID=A0A1I0CUU8_9FIRM|nr:flagellar hook-associated protein FlgK [[Clostridium] polysaccharolyticum]SET23172.1 flagellar hook-associated protein 1 FlgK [[Clostridium] polysaccharolyticum]
MASTFFGLSIATSGLYASQASMNTTAHNVSNANREGYTRQQTVLKANKPISTNSSYGMIGTGVVTDSIIQIRDLYYDTKYRTNQAIYGNYSTQQYYMLSIENTFSEVNAEGITKSFDNFNLAMQELLKDAGDNAKRTQVSSMAAGFTELVNSMANTLEKLQGDCNEEIKVCVEQVNSLASQIASLNKQINTIELSGQNANDLRDSRNLLLDRLSVYANIDVSETTLDNGMSTIFTVRMDGQVLVDNYESNKLEVKPLDIYYNLGDIDGLYNVIWSNGQEFNEESSSLGGKLEALMQMRDGNNLENLSGAGDGKEGETVLTLTETSCNDISRLYAPAQKGVLTIGANEYQYSSFDCEVVNGKYTYKFHLTTSLSEDVAGKEVQVGKRVSTKGIPYYMNQLTDFVRTYASEFNAIHNKGQDLNGVEGVDFFTGRQANSDKQYEFAENLESFTFSSTVDPDTDVNANGNLSATYYSVNCKNFTVNNAIVWEPDKIACTQKIVDGISKNEILQELVDLKTDPSMFKQGTPDMFLQKLTTDSGTDAKKATTFTSSQENILKVVDSQRMSVSSVDQDEESMDLVKFQNAYNLSSKVIQTMNRIYDTLINGLGI